MRTLHRTVKRGVSAGEPLPAPWPSFEANKMTLRRGTVNMVAGPPGAMKTVFTLNLVKQVGVPTMYHSNDSDDFTMASRSLAMATGMTTDEAELSVMAQSHAAFESLKQFEHVRWCFDSSTTLERMGLEADAFFELKGEYPHLTVIDIMMSMDEPGVGEQNYWGVMEELKAMARAQETCILVVHHTSESAKAGSPPPRSAIMGKANQTPALILTLWGDAHAERLDIATAKNRFGPQDPTASKYISMKAQPGVCLIEELDAPELLFRDGTSVPDQEKIDVWED